MKEQIISQGAEAVLIKRKVGEMQFNVLKKRVKKGYRFPELDDKLRKSRTKREAKALDKSSKLVNVPQLKKVDERTGEIDMEFIDGVKLSECLDELENWKEVCNEIGKGLAKLHDAGIMHGDLTTSNLIWVDGKKIGNTRDLKLSDKSRAGRDSLRSSTPSGKLYFIDFGLSFTSERIEDRAVDLHLIKQALEAKHFAKASSFFMEILKGYKKSKDYKKTVEQFEKVERRGRYKNQY